MTDRLRDALDALMSLGWSQKEIAGALSDAALEIAQPDSSRLLLCDHCGNLGRIVFVAEPCRECGGETAHAANCVARVQ